MFDVLIALAAIAGLAVCLFLDWRSFQRLEGWAVERLSKRK